MKAFSRFSWGDLNQRPDEKSPPSDDTIWPDPIDVLSLRQAREEVRERVREIRLLQQDREMLISALARIASPRIFPGRAREIALACLRKLGEDQG